MPKATKDTLFKTIPHKDKAENTNSAARAIINAEANARDKKTARLKELREAKEAAEPAPEPKKTPARKAAAAR